MAQVTITINSREYSVVAEDGKEDNIFALAQMLDEKAKMITSAIGQINENMLLAMTGLLIADELSELKKSIKSGNVVATIDNSSLEQQDKEIANQINNITNKINSIVKDL